MKDTMYTVIRNFCVTSIPTKFLDFDNGFEKITNQLQLYELLITNLHSTRVNTICKPFGTNICMYIWPDLTYDSIPDPSLFHTRLVAVNFFAATRKSVTVKTWIFLCWQCDNVRFSINILWRRYLYPPSDQLMKCWKKKSGLIHKRNNKSIFQIRFQYFIILIFWSQNIAKPETSAEWTESWIVLSAFFSRSIPHHFHRPKTGPLWWLEIELSAGDLDLKISRVEFLSIQLWNIFGIRFSAHFPSP